MSVGNNLRKPIGHILVGGLATTFCALQQAAAEIVRNPEVYRALPNVSEAPISTDGKRIEKFQKSLAFISEHMGAI